MDHELANALKVAGFRCEDGSGGNRSDPAMARGVSALPPLSALIEACGERFYDLRHSGKWWAAGFFQQDNEDLREMFGDTAEEAVARLWIALHDR